MDQSTLVGNQVAGGRRFVERFAADGNLVSAAFWVKTEDEGLWFLHVATNIVDQLGPAAAYRAIHTSLQKLRDPGISSSEIKVISPDNPIARDVEAVMTSQPGRLGTRLGGKTLGSIPFEQTYIYPPHFFRFSQTNPMTTEEVGQAILGLMNQGPGPRQPARVELRDGTAFNGVPFSIQLGSRDEAAMKWSSSSSLMKNPPPGY